MTQEPQARDGPDNANRSAVVAFCDSHPIDEMQILDAPAARGNYAPALRSLASS